jgi:hypothetical protein
MIQINRNGNSYSKFDILLINHPPIIALGLHRRYFTAIERFTYVSHPLRKIVKSLLLHKLLVSRKIIRYALLIYIPNLSTPLSETLIPFISSVGNFGSAFISKYELANQANQ